MIIRDVEDKDANKIRQYANDFMDYYPLKIDYEEYDLLKTLEVISDTGIFLVAEKDDKVVGGVGGAVTPHPFAPMHLMASEMFLWVDEDHRNSTVGPRLLKSFENKAKEIGCKYLSVCSTIHTPKFKKYLNKQNYKEVETSYMKEI